MGYSLRWKKKNVISPKKNKGHANDGSAGIG